MMSMADLLISPVLGLQRPLISMMVRNVLSDAVELLHTLYTPSPALTLKGYRGVYGTLYNQFAGVVFSYSPLEDDVIS